MKILSALLLLSIIYACQPAQEKTAAAPAAVATETVTVAKNCTYTFDATKTQIKWVAFKTPKKVGVGGAFAKEDFQLANPSNSQFL